jgi:transglutaminase-like putative cysteine protease/Tfp pilus assembly protein PilF
VTRPLFRTAFAALLAAALSFAPPLLAQGGPLAEALTLKALDRDDRAAPAFAALAAADAEAACKPGAPAAPRIAAEAEAAMAFALYERQPADPDLPARLLALRGGDLGRLFPDVADQIGIAGLEFALDNGRGRELAAGLGCLGGLWLCGPFDNERGAAFARTLPSESGFDPDASYPGKLRAVAWRRLADAAPNGRFDLGNVLRPAAQVACTVAVALVAEADEVIALHLGSAGSWRARLNGREVGARDVDRRFAFDQDAVALPLQRGSNLLLVKFCHQETGDFQVSLRFRALDGAPLRAVAVREEPADLRAAAAVRAAAAENAAPLPAPRQGARSLVAPGDAKGYDALWLAELWFLRGADGNVDRRDRALAQRAFDDLPDLPQARFLLAATRVRQARVSAELDENERRGDYEQLLAKNDKHVEAAVELGRLLLTATGLRARAEELARQALLANGSDPWSHLLLAEVLQARKQPALAREEWLAAAQVPGAPLAALRAGASAAGDDRSKLYEQFAARIDQLGAPVEWLLARAQTLLRHGQAQQALDVLQSIGKEQPLLRRAHAMRAEIAEAGGRWADAVAAWTRWLALCPDDDDALIAQSRAFGRLGERDRQIDALRAAIECNPNRRDDQRYLEFLAADATPFFSEWQRDAAPMLAVPTPAAAATGNDPTFTLLSQRVVRAHKNGTTSTYQHDVVRVLSEAGAREFANYRLPYFGGEQNARLLACTVHKADGRSEQPRLRGPSVALPSLQPGDTIDVEGRVDDVAPTFFGDYFGLEHRFPAGDGGATHRAELVVVAEPGRDYRFQVRNGAPEPAARKLADGATAYEFAMDDLPRDVPEPRRPDGKERQPLVRFTTFRDWDGFATWYWSLIKNQIEVTEPMRQKVRELTAGLDAPAAKIAAIYRFVTTDVRYEAWEFGVHGYKPYSTAVIFERRHGDCKDKALLLCAMLSEIAVTARPVLILADDRRSRDDLELPLVQHFNHCIAWMPAQQGRPEQFLDGTATWHPPTVLPSMDQGADVLVVDAGKAQMRKVPVVAPADNGDTLEFAIDLAADGTALVHYRSAPRGNDAVGLRVELGSEPARRKEHVERMLQPLFGEVSVHDIVASDPLALDAPVELRVTLDLPRIGQRSAGEWQLPSALGDDPLLQLDAEPSRINPLLLGIPAEDRRVLRYRLPPGMQAAELPPAAAQRASFGSFKVDWRRDGDQIVVERTVALGTNRIETADYAAFRDFVAALRTADSRRIVLRGTEGHR